MVETALEALEDSIKKGSKGNPITFLQRRPNIFAYGNFKGRF